MTSGLEQLYTEQFSNNLLLNLQQRTSLLRGRVMEGSHIGKSAAVVDYVAPVSMKAPAGRFSLLNQTDTSYMRRWVTPVDKELVQRVSNFDLLKTLENPTSALVSGAAAAVAREWDDRIIASAFATVTISNTDGTSQTTETWAQAQNGLTGSNTGLTIDDEFGNGSTTIGLTVDKLIEAQRLMRHYHVLDAEMQPGDLTLVIGSQQHADLLKLVEVVSREFAGDETVYATGVVRKFMGWNIIVSERLTSGADPVSSNANCRQCLAFVKSGLYLGVWLDMKNNVTQETLLSDQPYQIYTAMSCGGTRLEAGRLIQISCGNDTAGGDNI